MKKAPSVAEGWDFPSRSKFAVFAPVYPPARLGGGPIRTLKALIEQQPADVESLVFTQDTEIGQRSKLPVDSNRLLVCGRRATYFVSWRNIAALRRGFAVVKQFDPGFLYLNGFFTPVFSLLPQLLWRLGYFGTARLILAPRGEFSEGALSLKAAKKKVFLKIYKLLQLHRGIIWHASAQGEADDIARLFGKSAQILIRENETDLPQSATPVIRRSTGALQIIFVSRLVDKKGLHVLLECLKFVTAAIEVHVYGTAENHEYLKRCEILAVDLPANVEYAYRGRLEPEDVCRAFSSHDLFVFPTAGENFGHVIAESLSASCPVMCSDQTPWTEILQAGAGVVLKDFLPSTWAAAIEAYASLVSDARQNRRIESAELYAKWRTADKGKHIFGQASDLADAYKS